MSSFLAFENYLDNANDVSTSSENSTFPATNITGDRRVKVWRSNGYYNVTSSNNEILFNEGGSDVTATITAAEYTSGSSFLSAVESAMEAASPNTRNYTVSYDATTGKIRIAVTSGTFEVKWGSSSAADMLGFDPTDDSGASAYIADALRLHTNEFVLVDLGIASIPYAFIAINQRNESIPLSPNATLTIEGNSTNTFSTTQFSQTLTYDNSAIAYSNLSGFAAVGYRYWRFNVVDRDNGNGYVSISKLFLGDVFNPSRGAMQFGARFSHIDDSITSFAIGGQSFSEIRSQSESFGIRYFGLTNAEKEQLETVFREKGTHTKFFMVIDNTAEAMTTDNEYYIRYVKFASPPTFSIVSPGNWGCDITLREQL